MVNVYGLSPRLRKTSFSNNAANVLHIAHYASTTLSNSFLILTDCEGMRETKKKPTIFLPSNSYQAPKKCIPRRAQISVVKNAFLYGLHVHLQQTNQLFPCLICHVLNSCQKLAVWSSEHFSTLQCTCEKKVVGLVFRKFNINSSFL